MLCGIQLIRVFDGFLVENLCQWNCYKALHKETLSLCLSAYKFGYSMAVHRLAYICLQQL